jgi:hypothetical protein
MKHIIEVKTADEPYHWCKENFGKEFMKERYWCFHGIARDSHMIQFAFGNKDDATLFALRWVE